MNESVRVPPMEADRRVASLDPSHCVLCPRCCGVDRFTEKGVCGIGVNPVVAKAFPHFGEEPCISGTRGSGTVFFSGCSLHCDFCQNAPISLGGEGRTLPVHELAETFVRLAGQGVHNLNLVTPSHQAHAIEGAFELLQSRSRLPDIPVIWNSGGYDAVETVRRMSRWISVWLPDLKFADPDLSGTLAGAPDYFETATRAISTMVALAGPSHHDQEGLLRRGVLIRHLVIPGHTRDSLRVLEWIAATFGNTVPVSLMSQYTPMPQAKAGPRRRLTRREADRVMNALFRLGLENGYVQELSASGTGMIPVWDGEGLSPD